MVQINKCAKLQQHNMLAFYYVVKYGFRKGNILYSWEHCKMFVEILLKIFDS